MSMQRAGQKLIKGEALIRVSRVEKSSEINKRACPFIRHLRVIELYQIQRRKSASYMTEFSEFQSS